MAILTLWFRVQSEVRDGRRGRTIEVFGAHGEPLTRAWAEPWARTIIIGGEMLLVRRRLFPLTGRVDVMDADSGAFIGRTGRGGVVRNGADREIGRFRDARTTRDFVGEGLFDLLGAVVMGGDGSGSTSSGPTGYVWHAAGGARGRLYRATWPFAADASTPVPREHRPWPARLLPERFAALLRRLSTDPVWVLEVEGVAVEDQRLMLAAAVFAIELSHW